MTVGPQSGYQKEDRHSGKQECTGYEIVLFIAEEKVYYDHCYIGKPEKVWYDKYFAKWNIVVESHMNDTIMTCDSPLQMSEP